MEELELDVLDERVASDVLKPRPYLQYICYCGCREFKVYGGMYETSIKCAECDNHHIVHDG